MSWFGPKELQYLMLLSDLGRLPHALQWGLLVVGGVALGLGMEFLHVPAALLLGPLIWAAILGMRGMAIRVTAPTYQFGQAIAGALIGLNINPQILAMTTQMWPVVLLFVILTLVFACAAGLVATRLTGLDREVAMWGFMPGMAGTMIALAHDRGLDSRMVAFIQILRLLMVIAAMVAFGAVLVGPALPHAAAEPGQPALAIVPTLLLGALGVATGKWLKRIPAGASLVPILVGGVLCLNGIAYTVPHWLVTAAFFFLGAQTGLRFTPEIFRVGAKALPMLVLTVVLLLVLCGVSGVVLSLVSGSDLMSSVLATVPGSIDSIALVALSTGSDMSFIMVLQTTRLFAVIVFGPPIARTLLQLLKLARI
ncbi:Membrane AbrB duplication domain protein [Neorhizobium galegae bv. orientalis]|nr:Membrane AbrB duplication domain protein [Neorhizobium galegae bv. orientalis]